MLGLRAEFAVVRTARESELVRERAVDDVGRRRPIRVRPSAGRGRAPPVHEVVVRRLFYFELVALAVEPVWKSSSELG